MKRLDKTSFERVAGFFGEVSRPLDTAVFENRFSEPCEDKILRELKRYQNADGGFGNGLEPDFLLPLSSPLATSVAFQYIVDLKSSDPSEIVGPAVGYLEKTFVPERMGWYAVPEEVNGFAHAPWWHCDGKTGMTVIDRSWGNPSAEIIGYLHRYGKFVTKLDVSGLLENAVEHLDSIEEFRSEHEIYCYIRLYGLLPREISDRMKGRLTEAVGSLVYSDEKDWDEYVPKPLDFVYGSEKFGITEEQINVQLDYLVGLLETKGVIEPVWSWGVYPDEWKASKRFWTGILTLRALKALDDFGRIER